MKNHLSKYLLFNFFFIISITSCFSQIKVKFIIADSLSNTQIEFANIELKDISTGKVVGGITNIDGKLDLSCTATQSYSLNITYVGYIKYTKKIEFKNDTTLSIFLQPNSQMLSEIEVRGKKAVLENKPDRLVYNIDNKNEKGKKVSEVMRKVPFVVVTNDALFIKGNSNYKILQNGNPSNLTLLDLNNMPSSMVESIELITAPSSKFEGNYENIINIVLKKNENFHGGTTYARLSNRTSSTGLSVTNNSPKININYSLNLTFDRLKSGSSAENTYTGDKNFKLIQEETSEKKSPSFSSKFGTEIKISENKFLGFGGKLNLSNDNIKSIYVSNLEPLNQKNEATNMISTNTTNIGLDANYSQKINKNQKFYISNLLNYSRVLYSLQSENINDKFENKSDTKTLEYATQVDYELSMKNNFKADAGIKFLLREYNNSPNYNQILGEELKYSQTIYSSYISLSKNFKSTFIRLGTRVEETDNVFNSNNLSSLNILPNLLFSIKPTENSSIRFAYRKRVQRPSLRFLNTFVNKETPLTEYKGNPYLKNETFETFELENSLILGKSNISISLAHINGNDLISSNRLINQYQTDISYGNLSTSQSNDISFSFNTPLFKDKIYFMASGSIKYYAISSILQKNEGSIKTINIGVSANPTQKLSIDFFANYLPNSIFLQGSLSNSIFVDISARYHYKKYSFLIQINNPIIDKINESYDNSGEGFIFSGNSYYLGRSIGLGFSYSFGKTKDEIQRTKSIKNTDLKESGKY